MYGAVVEDQKLPKGRGKHENEVQDNDQYTNDAGNVTTETTQKKDVDDFGLGNPLYSELQNFFEMDG